MKNHDSLTATRVDELVRLAGGTQVVASHLEVPVEEVVRWHFTGLEDARLAIQLVELSTFTDRPQGRPRRSVLLTATEIREAVDLLGGIDKAAAVLQVNTRTLRRYAKGETLPSREAADAIRKVLLERRPAGMQQSLLALEPPPLTTPLIGVGLFGASRRP